MFRTSRLAAAAVLSALLCAATVTTAAAATTTPGSISWDAPKPQVAVNSISWD
ncbi:hypothetical protein [Streptomyces sp. NBC_00503]|uniref:hypothetical protein n=1 Tax=Streptomyces sp. NBC_00503 TaxID=2903659 RepID=UPI002E8166CD|nr:hypothetical protein [Streptomyces sp. NBC_00503]WUD83734.1 hypothetical protein OG490_26035 [Streptomyces sp. NBC_00503]